MKKIKHIVSISGGKDSTALASIAVEKMKKTGKEFIFVFADTGNEHQITLDYVDYLEKKLKIKIHKVKPDLSHMVKHKRWIVDYKWRSDFINGKKGKWKPILNKGFHPVEIDQESGEENEIPDFSSIPQMPENLFKYHRQNGWEYKGYIAPMSKNEANKICQKALGELYTSGNPFLDLCMAKGRFPSRMAQFCTQYLKAQAIQQEIFMPLLKKGFLICSWQGVRAQESIKRAKDPILQQTDKNVWAFRLIKHWTWQDVFKRHDDFNIKPNPLYTMGMGRVGCMPCINCGKKELLEISKRFPQEIERIKEWETRVSKCSKRGVASFFYNKSFYIDQLGIDNHIEWSKTSRGGKQYNMHNIMNETPSCSSAYGLCE